MAETIRIEIPVSVNDNTDPALTKITNKLSKMAQALNKVSKAQQSVGRMSNLEKSLSKMDKTMGGNRHAIEITAEDLASPVISDIEGNLSHLSGTSASVEVEAEDSATEEIANVGDAASALDGESSEIELGADDQATSEIADVGDAATALDGTESNVELGAEDSATEEIDNVEDALNGLNGDSAQVELSAEDDVTPEVANAHDALAGFEGDSATADIGVNDNATEVINSAMDAGSQFDGSTFTATLAIADNASSGINNATSAGANTVRNGIGTAVGFAGLSLGIGSALNSYSDFSAGMSQVAAISGATGDELDSLTAKAQEMGAKTKFTATQSAEAFNYMAMAGWKTGDMLNGIEGIMNLAAASGESLGTTSDIVTDALTAFGLQASDSTHFADVMAQASANANTNVGMLGESFKYVAPLAGTMGYSIEDTALALGLMANNGVKGSMAGTSLRTAISNLAAPTKAMREAMDKYGISLTDGEGQMKTLDGVMRNVRSSLRGLSEDEQAAAVKTIFGKNAMSGMLAIINSSEEDYNSLAEAIGKADGASERMADTMLDNMKGSLTLLQSAFEGVQNTLGARLSPYIRSAADALTQSMPGLQKKVGAVMDFVDARAGRLKTKMSSIFNSDEWKNSDIIGKVDIAWNGLIAEPFKKWAEGDGVTMISGGVGALFSKAFKILPGGEEAGLTDWLSAGIIAKGGFEAAKGVSALTSALAALPGPVGAVAGAGIAIGTAVGAIKLAVDHYNELTIQNNLAEHFGNLSLSAEQAKEFAGQIIPIEDITAELHVSEVAFQDAESLRVKAENKLSEINTLQWKIIRADFDTSEFDIEDLKTKAGELRDILVEQMDKQEEGTNSFIKAILGDRPEAAEITQTISDWFDIDTGQIDSISNSISEILQNSIESGAESVETATAVSILQSKMMEIANGAKKAELQGKLDWLEITSSGAALDADSWAMVVEDIGSMTKEFMNADAEAYEGFLGTLRQLEWNDPSRHAEAESIRNVIKDAQSELKSTSVLQGWSWMYNSLNEVYGSEIEQAKSVFDNFDLGNLDAGIQVIDGAIQEFGKALPKGTKGALADRVEKMLPTVESLQSIIDNATEPVPEAIMTAYNNAVELAALSGNENYKGQWWANMIAGQFDGMGDFQKALEERGLSFADMSEEMQDAFSRALTETTADKDYSGILNSLFENLSAEDIDWNVVSDILKEAGYDITDALNEQGIELSDNAEPKVHGSVTPDLSEIASQMKEIKGAEAVGTETIEGELYVDYKILPGNTLSGIAADNNLSLDQILADNPEITNPDAISVDQVIRLRASDVEVDLGSMEERLSEALNNAVDASGSSYEATAEGIKIKLGEVEIDNQSAAEQIASAIGTTTEELANAAGVETAKLTAGAEITIPADMVSTDASAAVEATDADVQDAYAEGFDTESEVEADLSQTNNVDEIYSEVDGIVQSTFAAGYSTHASVAVTLDWHITNPTANIGVLTSGGTATASIGGASFSAEGRYVDGPLLSWIGEDGPEFVVPVSAKHRSRGIELWNEAGKALGIPGFANGGLVGGRPNTSADTDDGDSDVSSTPVSVNVNGEGGNGKVVVQVTLAPQFNLGEADENTVLATIRSHMKEIANDVGSQIADMLSDAAENTPVAI